MRPKLLFFILILSLSPVFMLGQNAKVLSKSEQKEVIWRHNHWRQLADPDMQKLEWSPTLAMAAKLWANELGQDCKMKHSKMKYGENIFWGSASFSAKAVVDSWAEERHDYDYDKNTCEVGAQCGHYTQIVWRKTTRVGCAKVRCSNGNEIWVCVYDPAGNYEGEKPY